MTLHLIRREETAGQRLTVFDALDDVGTAVGVVSQDPGTLLSGNTRFFAASLGSAPQWRSYGYRSPEQAFAALEDHLAQI